MKVLLDRVLFTRYRCCWLAEKLLTGGYQAKTQRLGTCGPKTSKSSFLKSDFFFVLNR